ncbi:XRE family transcriptional regulator [Labedella phragmitis]|uniref:XRE family transcriptional regulator n=1 Tax=Labedella phragmitis TaxID=2498849 RepID=A0A3S4DP70_9MICO|nr:XRE family transcriptional regulator [Labedella phragmitis]
MVSTPPAIHANSGASSRGSLAPQFTVADRLRKARELTGLDQGEFAARAGFARTTVVNYELGHRVPRALYLRAWADASGVEGPVRGRGRTFYCLNQCAPGGIRTPNLLFCSP